MSKMPLSFCHKLTSVKAGQQKDKKLGDVTEKEMNKVLQSDNNTLHEKLKKLEGDMELLKSQNKVLQKEKDRAVERLSEEWSAKLMADEKNLENINIKNRPVTVAEKYEMLCANSWLDAKTAIDNMTTKLSDEEKFEILVQVLLTGQNVAAEKYVEVTSKIYEMICVHIEVGTSEPHNVKENGIVPVRDEVKPGKRLRGSQYMKVCRAIPANLRNAIGDFLRMTCDSTNISAITNEIEKKLTEKFRSLLPNPKTITEKDEDYQTARQYLEDCGRLAWSMVAQRPPMTFDKDAGVNEKYKGEKVQDLHYGSTDPNLPDSIVCLYVHPALMHDDQIMVKGRVLLKKK